MTNLSGAPAAGLVVTDTMPSGFRYVDGSATVAGKAVTPRVVGRTVVFEDLSAEGHGEIEIRLRLLALSSASPGVYVNRALLTQVLGTQQAAGATGSKAGLSVRKLAPEASAPIEVLPEPVLDCGDIVGKVFDDINRNGYADDGEPGLPGVRIATAKGWLVTTDRHGRFHVACAELPDQRIGSNFIMKLDPHTLPAGYDLTTENPRVVRLTAGKMTKLDFGAAAGRVVRLDLEDGAFAPGRTELLQQWSDGIDRLIAVLAGEESVLSLTYTDRNTGGKLAEARMEHVKELILARWRMQPRAYELAIETRVERAE